MLQNNYITTPSRPSGPVYVPGEQYAFYMNFDSPISDPNFATFRLDLYLANLNDESLAAEGIGALSQDVVTGVTYNMYCVFVFPAIANGTYKFSIFDTATSTEKCRSNYIIVENDPKYYSKAPTCLFQNSQNFYGYDYTNLPAFFNVFRLPLNQIDYQYDLQKTQYRNATDERLRNIKSYRFPYVKIETYYFTQAMHDAFSVMMEHDGIYIDGQKYVTKDAYQVDNSDLLNYMAKGTVNAYIDNPDVVYVFPINTVNIINPTPDTMAQKTTISISNGLAVNINWQTDYIDGTEITYFQRHGNSVQVSEADLVNGNWVPNGVPSYSYTTDVNGNILVMTLSPQVLKSVFTFI